MNQEIALAVRFRADNGSLDRIFEMLELKSMQFTGGGFGRIILADDDKEEEIPPALEPLLLGLTGRNLDFGQDTVGYIRNKSRESVTIEQAKDIENWFAANVEGFQVGNLVDLWEVKG